MLRPYDITDKRAIIAYAKLLESKSLRDVCGTSTTLRSNKGGFGQLLEQFYFCYQPNSDSEPDFKEVGLELKSAALKQLKNQEYRAKERLVLNIINYLEEANQQFETSSFWRKNANLLLVFYLHQAKVEVLDFIVALVDEWEFPADDLEIIKRDWALIQSKIINGKAHELSEGDTFYLGACTKGSKGGNPRQQPNNSILAKQRAYSLKQGYLNHIVATIAHGSTKTYGKLISSPNVLIEKSIEQFVHEKFRPYYNKTVSEIVSNLNSFQLNPAAKNYHANIVQAILGVALGKKIEEFEKADITVKTMRLEASNLAKEHISFPTFTYEALVAEEWDDSEIKSMLEHKFLFVFFQFIGDELVLRKVQFWNMPFCDLQEVKKVWEEVVRVVKSGTIVKGLQTNGNRRTNFPGTKFNHVAHIRPHAKNANDTYPLPVQDQFTKSNEYTKHCFWLNRSYVRDEIYLKD